MAHINEPDTYWDIQTDNPNAGDRPHPPPPLPPLPTPPPPPARARAPPAFSSGRSGGGGGGAGGHDLSIRRRRRARRPRGAAEEVWEHLGAAVEEIRAVVKTRDRQTPPSPRHLLCLAPSAVAAALELRRSPRACPQAT